MKKIVLKITSIACALVCFASFLTPLSAIAEGTLGAPDASMFSVLGDGLTVNNVTNGARITFARNTPAWARAYIGKKYSLEGEGLELTLKDIASVDPDFSVAIKFSNNTGWYDTEGYTFVYGNSGDFSLLWMDGKNLNPNEAKILVSDKREALNGTLTIKIKYDNSKYLVTVNEKAYSVTAKYLSNPKDINIVFSAFGDGPIDKLDWNKDYSNGALGYTVSQLVNNTIGAGYTPIGDGCYAGDYGMNCIGGGIDYHISEKGLQLAFTNSAPDYARTGFESPYVINENPLHVVLSDFYSADPDYSIVVRLGTESVGWYDREGYFLVYGKSGNFSIFWADGKTINPNESKILVSDKLGKLSDKLDIEVALSDKNYIINVNGKKFSITNTYMENPDELYLSFGVFGDGNIKTLNFQKNFFLAAVSFIICPETYTPKAVSVRNFKTFADTVAFMSGVDKNHFKPNDNLTRKEAIVSLAKLITDKDAVKGVYTSDFKKLKSSDSDYDYIAFMERCGFLPDFSDDIKLDDAITRSEFIDLLLTIDDVDENISIGDIKADNYLYGKVCFAIKHGLISLDSKGNFNAKGTVTRAQAAKAICLYIGRDKLAGDAKITFSDVNEDNEYRDYIVLATNSASVYKETLIANSKNDLQSCVDEAIQISKNKDAIITVELSNNEYRLTKPITIDATKYGNHRLAIKFVAGKDIKPTVTGNVDLKFSNFNKVNGTEYYSYQLPESSKTDGSWPQFRDLYLNGNRLQIARSDDYLFDKTWRNKTYEEGSNTILSYDNWIYVNKDTFSNITNENLAKLELCCNVEWNTKVWPVSELHGIEESEMQLSICDESYNDYIVGDGNKVDFVGWTYWFQNHITLLDKPGEFYYDSENGVIYIYPYKNIDIAKSTVSYPAVEKLFDIEKASDITFKNITFTGTTSNWASIHGFSGALGGVHAGSAVAHENIPAAAIYGKYTKNISVYNCTFKELGTNGINLMGGNNGIVIKNSSFTGISMCAATFGKNFQDWNKREGQQNFIINNNYVYNIGTDYNNSPAFHCTRTYNIAFTHNTVIHTPYSGLMLGWINRPNQRINVLGAEVSYNRMEDNLYACNDGSPLYFAGANSVISDSRILNRVHDNYCKSTGYTKTYNGTYLDMNTSNYYVYNNVYEGFDTNHGPVFNQDHFVEQYTYNNKVSENFSTVRAITTIATADRNIALFDNKHFMTSTELPQTALKIIEASGQESKYSSVIPVYDTVVSMDVKEPHIKIPLLGKSDKKAVTFTVTNNSKKTSSYSVVNTNTVKNFPEIVASTDSLKLKPGETGEISVSFVGGDKIIREALMDFAVVQDNGWEMKYKRVIDIDVIGNISEDQQGNNLLIPIIIGIAVLVSIAAIVFIIIFKKKKSLKTE